MNKKELITIIFIFIIALSLRLGYLCLLKETLIFEPLPTTDSGLYHQWAKDFSLGRDLISYRAYGFLAYPYFLGLIYNLFGPNPYLVYFLQFLLGAVSGLLVYAI